MKKIYTISVFVLLLNSLYAQITFQKTYDVVSTFGSDDGYSVQQTTDGGYVIAGFSDSIGGGIYNAYLVRTDPNGNLLWTRVFGDSAWDDARSVQQTTDGGFVIAGTTISFGAGDYDVYVIKTDANGTLQWSKTIGGASGDYGYFIRQTTDGGYIIAGKFNTFLSDVYLVKLDASGALQWTKQYGGIDNEVGYCVQETSDGGYIISGATGSFGAGNSDIYLIKVNSLGNLQWSKTYGGIYEDYGYYVQQTTDNGFVVAGSTSSFGTSVLDYDLYFLKTDSLGNLQWLKVYANNTTMGANSIQQTPDGGFAVLGNSPVFGSPDIYFFKTDAAGNLLWSKSYGTSNGFDAGLMAQQTNDGGFIIAGYTNLGSGYSKVYLIKTDSTGASGCNENTPTVTVTSPTFTTSIAATTVSSGGVAGNPATQIATGGAQTTLCSSVGIPPDISVPQLFISPNPFSDELLIQGSALTGVKIFDVFGRIIHSQKITSDYCQIFTASWQNGIYFVEVNNGKDKTVKKFLKE